MVESNRFNNMTTQFDDYIEKFYTDNIWKLNPFFYSYTDNFFVECQFS